MNSELPWITILPFVVLILSIAVLPLAVPRWWERLRHRALVAFGLALPVAILLLFKMPAELGRTGLEYFAFIALLGSLFVISGGIVLTGDLRATPAVNTAFLGVGVILANIVGTTGASMLLIRPLLHTNSERRKVAHIPIFFIFLVSNIGGSLTPIGDPPLFLGFLRGVPFFWTLRLYPVWAFTSGLLLLIFYLIDRSMIRHETPGALRMDRLMIDPLRLRGGRNLLFLLGVIAAVFLPPALDWARPLAMILTALGSYFTTPHSIRRANQFSFFPISEVAILFAGLFVTMVPALLVLETHGARFGVHHPWQFFWLTGGLSSFLDNAPTYLSFTALALGVQGIDAGSVRPLGELARSGIGGDLLRAISLGAVFMGANTYIGNGPNFMVKSIAEERRVPMPSFFGYMLWSVGILVPLFVLVTLIFLL